MKTETKNAASEDPASKTPPPEDSGLSHNTSGNSGNSNFAQPLTTPVLPTASTTSTTTLNQILGTTASNTNLASISSSTIPSTLAKPIGLNPIVPNTSPNGHAFGQNQIWSPDSGIANQIDNSNLIPL